MIASLGGVVVARVGDVAIDRKTVLEVARARKISADEALAIVVQETLLARAAFANGAANDDAVVLREASALSRALLGNLRDKALATPFTDGEIATVANARWLTTDHPEIRRVTHALVKKDVPNARAVAAELRTALLAANGPDAGKSEVAFAKTAKEFKVPSGPAVHVEGLSIAADARVAEPGADGAVEESFAKATFAIDALFGTSDIVETTYGFHIIRLLEKIPPLHLTREQKLETLRADLIAMRVGPLHEQLQNQLRAATKTELLATEALAIPR